MTYVNLHHPTSSLSGCCYSLLVTLHSTYKQFFKLQSTKIYKNNCKSSLYNYDANQLNLDSCESLFKKHMNKPYSAIRHTSVQLPYHNPQSQYISANIKFRSEDYIIDSMPVASWYYYYTQQQQKVNYIYDYLYRQLKEAKSKEQKHEIWRTCLKKWSWTSDLYQLFLLFEVVTKVGAESFLWLKSKECPYRHLDVLTYSFQLFQSWSYFGSQHAKLKIGIKVNEKINEVSMARNAKQMFCSVCLLYCCQQHFIEYKAFEKNMYYCHPKTKINRVYHLRKARQLLLDKLKIYKNEAISGNRCSQHCYKNLNSTSFPNYTRKKTKFFSLYVSAFVNLGIRIFSFEPCKLFLMTYLDTTCAMLFCYLWYDYNLKQLVETGLYNSLYLRIFNGLTDDGASSLSSIYKELNKKKVSRRKKISKQFHQSTANDIPICLHSFFNEEYSEGDDGCYSCLCKYRGFCIPSCHCNPSKCKIQRSHCNCFGSCLKSECDCYRNRLECDIILCNCCSKKRSLNQPKALLNCDNMYILQKKQHILLIANSSVYGCGLGLFAGEPILKGHLITTYLGEIISHNEEVFREAACLDTLFYNFQFKRGALDAKKIGNNARFVNHDNKQRYNAEALIKFSGADYYLGLFALRDIQKDEEIFFDYDGEGRLYDFFRYKYPYIGKRYSNNNPNENVRQKEH